MNPLTRRASPTGGVISPILPQFLLVVDAEWRNASSSCLGLQISNICILHSLFLLRHTNTEAAGRDGMFEASNWGIFSQTDFEMASELQ
jgi:hypothetical protein